MAAAFTAEWLGERSGMDIDPDRCGGGGEGSQRSQMHG
jgi:hypothetical protein